MTNVDTPDYQVGVVSAQVLLAAVPSGTATVRVGIPPNAETLIVTAANIGTNPTVFVEGVSTLYKFPGALVVQQPFITAAPTWLFDVSNAVDTQVDVTFSSAPGTGWFVYADSGVHVTVDPSKLTNGYGQQYVIPSVPSVNTADHPPNELLWTGGNAAGNTLILPAPGANQRYRLFAAAVWPQGAWGVQVLEHITGRWLIGTGPAGGQVSITWPLTGITIATNQAVELQAAGVNNVGWHLTYTQETV